MPIQHLNAFIKHHPSAENPMKKTRITNNLIQIRPEQQSPIRQNMSELSIDKYIKSKITDKNAISHKCLKFLEYRKQ